jgi:hypothetical protein
MEASMEPIMRLRRVATVGILLASGARLLGQCDPTEVANLRADDAQGDDSFGFPLSIEGDTIVAVAWPDEPFALANGVPYVYARSEGAWALHARLGPPDVDYLVTFGKSVATGGNFVVIGAPRTPENGNAGSAFLYGRDNETWIEQGTLFAHDRLENDEFGQSVAMDRDTCVVGAIEKDVPGDHPGSVYVFVREGDAWTEQARLVPSGLHDYDFFGYRVAVSGDTILAGAEKKGSVYAFARDGGVWAQQAEFVGVALAAVAIDGDTAVIGRAPQNQPGWSEVFVRQNGVWAQEAKLIVPESVYGDGFGRHVAISGNRVVLGGPGDDNEAGVDAGSVFLFVRDGQVWTGHSRILASDGAEGDAFGRVAMSGETLAVAATGDDTEAGEDAGSVYVFDLGCAAPCHSDCDESGTLDLFDFLCFTNAFNAGDAYADCTGDGPLDLFDFLCFVNAFNEGCP